MDENQWVMQPYNDIKGIKDNVVSRILYLDKIKGPKYKYKEDVSFKKEILCTKKAICIGLNPAKAEKNLDITNKRLIKLLWDKYDGYTLLNLYPEITNNKKQINYSDKENQEFKNKLIQILKKSDKDIVIFFGRTTSIPTEIVEYINDPGATNRIKLTAHNGEFTHPGSNSDISLIDYSSSYIRNTNVIRVK